MTALADGETRTTTSSRETRLAIVGTVVAFAAPVAAGLAADLMRTSLCPADAWLCAGQGIWAQTLALALPCLAFFPPLLILGLAVARSAALAWRVLVVYGALFVLLVAPLWMMAAASYFSMTPRGIVRQNGPLGEGKIYRWTNIADINADCSPGTLGDAIPSFRLMLSDNTILDAAVADGFVAHYAELSKALAASSFFYHNHGARENCPSQYRELFAAKPGSRS